MMASGWPRRVEHPLKVIAHQNLLFPIIGMSVTNTIKTSWLIAAFVFLVGSSNAFGQEPVPSPSPQASPSETARPLYGLQGVLIETLDGKVVSGQNESEPFNPAS